jgi:archaellum component FlaC
MNVNQETTHEKDGVELVKYYDETEYNLPSVVYSFSSNRSEPVSVRVVEPIADDLDSAHIGFPKGNAREDWTFRETDLVLECTVGPNDEYETVYALRPEQSYDPDCVVVEPEAFEVNSIDSIADISGDFLRSAGSSDEAENGTENQSIASRNTVIDADDDGDLLKEISLDQPATGGTDPEKQKDTSLVDQLATELEEGAGSEESRALLKEELDLVGESRSTDARIRQLQSDLSDFRAYKNALKQFLDENGSAQELIDEFEARMDSFDEALTSLQSELREQDDAIDAVRHENEQIQSDLTSINSEIESLTASNDGLREELSSLDDRVPDHDVGEHMSEIEEQVTDISEFMDDLKSVFGRDTA